MVSPFTHDENQFVAAGVLIADSGLLPYIDFPHNHLPNLAFLYALAFRITGSSMLTARLISAVASWASITLITLQAYRRFRNVRSIERIIVSASLLLLWITNPMIFAAAGKAWNHDLPALFTIAAFALYSGSEMRPLQQILTGLFLGLAIGFRLTYLPVLLPFLISSVHRYRQNGLPSGQGAKRIVLGSAISLAPLGMFFLMEPPGFVFGIWTYQQLNTAYRSLVRHSRAMDLPGKARFLGDFLIENPMSLLLIAVLIAMVLLILKERAKFKKAELSQMVLASSLPIILAMGSLVPTPLWPQYFHGPAVAAVLAIGTLYSIYRKRAPSLFKGATRVAAGLAALALLLWTVNQAKALSIQTSTWIPLEIQRVSQEIADRTEPGKVLTLAPIFPLESGLGIYPSFATGPFSWRVSQFLLNSQWQGYSVISRSNLLQLLQDDPPQAILVGFETDGEGFVAYQPGGLEVPLRDYASTHGYTPVVLDTWLVEGEVTLWVR
jgi:hypothetical protein